MSIEPYETLAPSPIGLDDAALCDDEAALPHLPFHIQRDGTWLYRGTPIRRKAMLCLFASCLDRDQQGRYWLQTPTEAGIIGVEDVPFLAVELDFKGCSQRDQTLCLRTNLDEVFCIGEDHPLLCEWDRPADVATVPYIHMRAGTGGQPIMARISRAVLFELAALAVPGCVAGEPCLGVWSRCMFFPLSRLPEEGCAEAEGVCG